MEEILKKVKRAKRKKLIEFEYKDGRFEGGIFDPPLKDRPCDLIYYKIKVGKRVDSWEMTTDEASCIIACLAIALNQVLDVEKKIKR